MKTKIQQRQIVTLNSTCFEASAFAVFFICVVTSINIVTTHDHTSIHKCIKEGGYAVLKLVSKR